jgi:hypothetical protein
MRYPTLSPWIMLKLPIPAGDPWARAVSHAAMPTTGRADVGPRLAKPHALSTDSHREAQPHTRSLAIGNCPECFGTGCNDCCHTGR